MNKLKQIIMHVASIYKRSHKSGCFGATMTYKNITKNIAGVEPETTNKRLQLITVVKALQKLKEPCNVTIYSPSTYLCYSVNNGWLRRWKENGWVRSQGRELANKDIWQILDALLETHNVKFVCTEKQNKKSESYQLAQKAS